MIIVHVINSCGELVCVWLRCLAVWVFDCRCYCQADGRVLPSTSPFEVCTAVAVFLSDYVALYTLGPSQECYVMHVSLMWAGEGAELMRAETDNDL